MNTDTPIIPDQAYRNDPGPRIVRNVAPVGSQGPNRKSRRALDSKRRAVSTEANNVAVAYQRCLDALEASALAKLNGATGTVLLPRKALFELLRDLVKSGKVEYRTAARFVELNFSDRKFKRTYGECIREAPGSFDGAPFRFERKASLEKIYFATGTEPVVMTPGADTESATTP